MESTSLRTPWGIFEYRIELTGAWRGLDARWMISHVLQELEWSRPLQSPYIARKKRFKVKSLTTLCTPHRGSCISDWLLERVGMHRWKYLTSLPSIQNFILHGSGLEHHENDLMDGLLDLTTTVASRKFSQENCPDRDDTLYFSYSASSSSVSFIRPSLIIPHQIVLEREGPNDGLVSVESCKWGKYMGCLDADHFDVIGWKWWSKVNELSHYKDILTTLKNHHL